MGKKLLVLLAQAMAFAGVMSVVSNYVDAAHYWKLFIFGAILLAVNGGSSIAVISILEEKKKDRPTEKANKSDTNPTGQSS